MTLPSRNFTYSFPEVPVLLLGLFLVLMGTGLSFWFGVLCGKGNQIAAVGVFFSVILAACGGFISQL